MKHEFAAIGFRQVLQLRPDDGPSMFYLKQIAERAGETVNEQWATYTVVKEKWTKVDFDTTVKL